MTINGKIIIISVIILLASPIGAFWYYRRTHPRYVPEPRPEINITIKEGWNLRQIAEDWVEKKLVTSTEQLYQYAGCPTCECGDQVTQKPLGPERVSSGSIIEHPANATYEGFLFPDTYRVYASSTVPEILDKVFSNFENKMAEFGDADLAALKAKYKITDQKFGWYEVLTMASVVEKEAPTGEMAKVADIFWRRYRQNWALQSCATVNYVTGKSDPAVSAKDRQVDSLYNTYKYPGLPLGPIGNPGLEALRATIRPESNNFWYFMAGTDGVTHYAATLDEHNRNVAKYLR